MAESELALVLQKRRNIDTQISDLFDATKDKPRGSFISHDEIEQLTGFYPSSKSRPAHEMHALLIKKWKQVIRTRGIWVKAAYPAGTGYKFLTLEQQKVDEPTRIQKRRNRLLNEEVACIGSISVDELDEDGRLFQTARLGQLTEVKQVVQKQRALVSSWLSNPKTLPKLNEK